MNPFKNITNTVFLLMISVSFVCAAETINIGHISYSQSLLKVGAGETSLSAFDFNSDGHQDVIVANYSDNNVVVYRGDGKGNLIESSSHPAGENPTDMSVSDINGDGHIDVVIANHETTYLTLLYGDGIGGFKAAAHSPLNINVNPHPHVVRINDMDGDNLVDLIVDNRSENGLLIFKGLGNGNFNKQGQLIDAGGDPYLGFATGDINGDGKPDLVTPNQNEIGTAFNTSSNELSFELKKISPSESPFAVELAEMTGDNKTDLVVASVGSFITITPGDGQGNFVEEKKTSIKTSAGAKQIAVGDINGDGLKDALISNWSGDIFIALGSQTAIETFAFKNSSIPHPWGIVLADLNEDGKSDFIIADGDSELTVVYISQGK